METTREERDDWRFLHEAMPTDRCADISVDECLRLLNDADRLETVERQVLWRTEDMPGWAYNWEKENGQCLWTNSKRIVPKGCFQEALKAPDYRPEESGPMFLPILNPLERT